MDLNPGFVFSIPAKLENHRIIPLGEIPDTDDYDVIINFIKKEKSIQKMSTALIWDDVDEMERILEENR